MTLQPVLTASSNTGSQWITAPDVSANSYVWQYYQVALPAILRPHTLHLPDHPLAYTSQFHVTAEIQRQWGDLFGIPQATVADIPFSYLTMSGTLMFMRVLAKLGINFKYLRHYCSDIRFIRHNLAVRADHTYTICLELADIVKVRHDRIVIQMGVSIYDEQQNLCAVHTESFIVTNLAKKLVSQLDQHPQFNQGENEFGATYEQQLQDLQSAEWQVPERMGQDFGRLSGDMNVVHTTPWIARLMGNKKPFIQGFASVNRVLAHYITERQQPVSRITMHFKRPVFVGDTAQLYATDTQFEMANGAGKLAVYGNITSS